MVAFISFLIVLGIIAAFVYGLIKVMASLGIGTPRRDAEIEDCNLDFDFKWSVGMAVVGIDTTQRKILIRPFAKRAAIFDVSDVRDYTSEWTNYNRGSFVWKDDFKVLFSLRSIEHPKIYVSTLTQAKNDRLMETLNQAFEKIAAR